MSVWGVGQTVVTLLAAMQDVPSSVYEAADIDGASFWQKVRHVTLPMISPVIYFNAIMGIIGALQVFATPYIMTEGGPRAPRLFYTQRLYENALLLLCAWATRAPWRGSCSWSCSGSPRSRIGSASSRVHYTGA